MEGLTNQLKDLEWTVNGLRDEEMKLNERCKTLESNLAETTKVNGEFRKAMNLNSLSILKTQAIAHQEKNVALEQGINKDYDTYKVLEQEGIAMADEHKRKEEERCNFLDKCSEVDEEIRGRFMALTEVVSPMANLESYILFLEEIEEDKELPLTLNGYNLFDICAEGILDSLIAMHKRTMMILEDKWKHNSERKDSFPILVEELQNGFAQLETSI
ncbi:hypothetical protein TrCOL_g13789 [Triparma columacea]|uniref:Uncharacterized protein n=1 Tax=Triparma columacea TaxID=722753 RepID=A0A9W7GJ13_9STRA|nr:hypothetical protein TrCOL_g13789 [Triparma columacea]